MQMVSARRNLSISLGDDHNTLTCPLLSHSHSLHQVPHADSLVAETNMDGGGKGEDIRQLLAVEQEAQHIIDAAKTAKATRLKQAKEEAKREVASYRVRRENEFQKKLAETSGDSGSNMKRLEAETCSKIQHLTEEASKVSPEVVAMLVQCVTSVKI